MVDSAATDRAAEKVRKLVAMSAFLACRLIRAHDLRVSGHPPSAASAPGVPTAGVHHRQPTAEPHGFRRIRVRHPGHCRWCGKPIALGEWALWCPGNGLRHPLCTP